MVKGDKNNCCRVDLIGIDFNVSFNTAKTLFVGMEIFYKRDDEKKELFTIKGIERITIKDKTVYKISCSIKRKGQRQWLKYTQ